MTFLELCRRVRLDSGISGDIASVVNQQGILLKLVTWVQQAEYDIVTGRKDWLFMRAKASAVLQAGKVEYLPAELGMQPFASISKVYVDRQPLVSCDFDYLDDQHLKNGGAPEGTPRAFAITPDGTVLFDNKPAQALPVDIRYNRAAVRMTINTAQSPIPAEHEEVIIQAALMNYARHEQDEFLLRDSTIAYERHFSDLCNKQLPKVSVIGWGG